MLWIIWHIKPDVIGTHSSTDSWAGLIAAYLHNIKKRLGTDMLQLILERTSLIDYSIKHYAILF